MFTAEDEEWYIASSPDDAAALYEQTVGEPLEFATGEAVEWTPLPPEKPFRFNDNGHVTTKTCAEWVREKGRGYFASANI